jgi:LSD1 subclass zinc finger protein
MVRTFGCPSCGGPLEYKSGGDRMVRCSFCHNSIIVPDELRAPETTTQRWHARRSGGSRNHYLIFVAIAMALGLSVAFFALRSARPAPPAAQTANIPSPALPARQTPRAQAQDSGFATIALTFGSEGIGPGLFKDARSIAVDAAGNIYVGEYTGGRIQVFDAAGQFITQWIVDSKMPLRGMAADRKGMVYVVQRGVISRYEGASGKPAGQLEYPAGWGFDDVAVTADGGLVAAWYKNRDDIVRFDNEGRTTLTIKNAISGQTDSSELQTRIAVDGRENIYALGAFNDAVFKFTREGKFVSRFGSDGDQRGQFRAPSAIAVDGQGRVYVSDFKGIQVFDADGRYLDTIKVQGAASGMVFNDKGELFVVARTRVIKLTLKS